VSSKVISGDAMSRIRRVQEFSYSSSNTGVLKPEGERHYLYDGMNVVQERANTSSTRLCASA